MRRTARVIWPDKAETCDAHGREKRPGGSSTGGSKGPRRYVTPTADAEAFGRESSGGDEANRRRGGLQKLTPARVHEAIWKSAGVVSHAAQALGVSRQAFYKHLRTHPSLAKDLEEARETYLDIAESHIVRGVISGDLRLAQFYLRTKGKSRGWS